MKAFAVCVGLLLATPVWAGDAGERGETLIKKLDSKDVGARLAIIDELAELGPKAGKAAPALADLLREGDEDLRLNAALALGKIGKDAVAPVAKLLDVKD